MAACAACPFCLGLLTAITATNVGRLQDLTVCLCNTCRNSW